VTSIRRPQPVELRLVVLLPDGRTREVAVEAAPSLTTRDLLEAIGRERGTDAGNATLHGQSLRPDVPVSELALRWGDELRLAGANGAVASPLATLVVAGGPDAGRRIPLPTSTHTVGREAGISIDDPSLSGHHVVVTVDPDGAVALADAGSRNGSLLDGLQLEPGSPHPLEAGTFVRAGRSLLGIAAPERAVHPQGGSAGLVQVNRPPRVRRVPQAVLSEPAGSSTEWAYKAAAFDAHVLNSADLAQLDHFNADDQRHQVVVGFFKDAVNDAIAVDNPLASAIVHNGVDSAIDSAFPGPDVSHLITDNSDAKALMTNALHASIVGGYYENGQLSATDALPPASIAPGGQLASYGDVHGDARWDYDEWINGNSHVEQVSRQALAEVSRAYQERAVDLVR
jgi:FHA domain